MYIKERHSIYRAMDIKEGRHSRMATIIEELSELIGQVSKYIQHDDDFDVNNMLDEVADVKLGLEQLELFFDKDHLVDAFMQDKMYRLMHIADMPK